MYEIRAGCSLSRSLILLFARGAPLVFSVSSRDYSPALDIGNPKARLLNFARACGAGCDGGGSGGMRECEERFFYSFGESRAPAQRMRWRRRRRKLFMEFIKRIDDRTPTRFRFGSVSSLPASFFLRYFQANVRLLRSREYSRVPELVAGRL